MSRWTYKTEKVTAGDNSQTVRTLTSEERKQFSQTSKRITAGELTSADIPQMIVQWGAINPVCSLEDVASMPPDLLDACVDAIMRLSGMADDSTPGEKKETTDSAPTN